MSDFTSNLVREIDETIVETLDLGTRDDAKHKAGSRRDAYEKGIDELRDIAGEDAARELAEWIQEEVRTDESFPSARNVRQRGAAIAREHDHSVSTGSWLGA